MKASKDCANCKWTDVNHKGMFASLTCGKFVDKAKIAKRNAALASTLTVVPERCPKCKEALTPKVTKGSYKCKCDQPGMPNCLVMGHPKGCKCFREKADRAPLTPYFRYGGGN